MKEFFTMAFWGTAYMMLLVAPLFVLFAPMAWTWDFPVEQRWPFCLWGTIAIFAAIPTMLAWAVGPMMQFDAWLDRRYPL